MEYHCKKCGWKGEVAGRPRCLACYRRRMAEWRIKNPEKAKVQKSRYDKRFRETRPEQYNAKRRKYRKTETDLLNRQKRIEWFLAGDVTRDQLITIFDRDRGCCVYCGQKVRPRFSPLDPRGFDHVKPRSKGGQHTASNIVTCCRKCNELKGESDTGPVDT